MMMELHKMKTLENCCFLALLLLLTSWTLEARPSTPSVVLGIGSSYQEKQSFEQLSFGLEFDTVTSTHLIYQRQDIGERFDITIDRTFPLRNRVSLLGSVGSTIWLGDKQNDNISFNPIFGVGIRYDWSPYVSTSLSYQYVFSEQISEVLKPTIGLALSFRPFNHNVSEVEFFAPQNKTRPTSVKLDQRATTVQGCNIGKFLRSFYFAHNRAVIDIQAEDINWFLLNSSDNFIVIGHTDETGDEEYNQRLGLRRAEFIKETLVKYGVEDNKISACSRGEVEASLQKKPIDRWMFRRVDVYLSE